MHVFKLGQTKGNKILPEIKTLVSSLNPILPRVRDHNAKQNEKWPDRIKDPSASENSFLLPMAFPEGSPNHPSYGAGHAVGKFEATCYSLPSVARLIFVFHVFLLSPSRFCFYHNTHVPAGFLTWNCFGF